ncbi:MAG: type II secretion system protein [Verrucomicrobia bacterium]|nr:type II secretion system protein [Verrucomicrobiota bacterium]
MKLYRRKKRAITLLEIMIVIFLIGLIGSVIGYNVKGSLEEGKAFRTEQGAAQIQDILSLEASYGTPLEEITKNPEFYLKRSGLCKDPKKLLKDGWGKEYTFSVAKNGSDIKVCSENLIKHCRKKGKKPPKLQTESDEDEDDDIDQKAG